MFGIAPRAGGWHDQDSYELLAAQVVARAEQVYVKPAAGEAWTDSDAEFIGWVESEGGSEDGRGQL